jgi:DNA topoisomerase-1
VRKDIISAKDLRKRWDSKRESIYNLRDRIDSIKRKVREDLKSRNEKDRLTALVVRIMMITSERVGNHESAKGGHFGITQLRHRHITVTGNEVCLKYIGKSGVKQEKCFSDESVAGELKILQRRDSLYVFTTKLGFRIKPDRVNRYLSNFGVKSKDIRGYNANRLMIMELKRIGKIADEKKRPKVFNEALRKIGKRIGHGAPTLRTHYLLPELEKFFYQHGSVGKINID